MKHCTVIPIKDQKAMYVRGVKICMSEVSKVHTGPSIQSNVTHVKGVESSSLYPIRVVMLYMSMVSKEVQNGLTHLCL